MEDHSNEIGQRIKKYRKEAKLSQTELAEKLNKTMRTVQKYESGEIQPPLYTIDEIANILNVSLADLVGYEKDFMHINSFADVISFIYELDKKEELSFEIEVHRPPQQCEWSCSIRFDGLAKDARNNPALCLFLQEYQRIRAEYKSYMIDERSFDDWVDRNLAYYSDIPLHDKEYEILTTEERLKKMLELDRENMKKRAAEQDGDK